MKIKIKENLALKIISLIIAILLWFYIQMVENPETEYVFRNVEVTLTNRTSLDNKNLTVVGEDRFTTDITLKCQRWSLNELKNEGFQVYCDLSEVEKAGKAVLPVRIVINNDKITVVKRNPTSITLDIENVVTVERPIKFNINGKVKDGFYTNEDLISSEYKTVSITGPESVLKKVSCGVVNIDLGNRDESFDLKYEIVPVDDNDEAVSDDQLTVLNNHINVSCVIYEKKVVDINITNIGEDIEYDISPPAVEIAGAPEDLENITGISIDDLYLGSYEKGYSQEFKIPVPDNVILLTGKSGKITIK